MLCVRNCRKCVKAHKAVGNLSQITKPCEKSACVLKGTLSVHCPTPHFFRIQYTGSMYNASFLALGGDVIVVRNQTKRAVTERVH